MTGLRWHTLACIGQGSNSTVHRARLLPTGGLVAVKRLQQSDARYVRRLRQEAELVTGLQHQNIVRLLGMHEDTQGLALIMELVDGCTVARLLDTLAPAPAVVLHIARSLFAALAHAHDAGVVHRDISPRNVLLSWDGDVKLTDFGLAKRQGCPPTTAGAIRGTVPYVSPEQLQGAVADQRSDLFAAGMLLYELIAGQLPFDGDVMLSVARIVRGTPIPSLRTSSPWVSRELDAVVMKLLARDVDERYHSAHDVLADLPAIEHGREELVAVMDVLRESQSKPQPCRWRKMALAAALFGALGMGATIAMNQGRTTPSQQTITAPPRAPDVVEHVGVRHLVIQRQPSSDSDRAESAPTEHAPQTEPATDSDQAAPPKRATRKTPRRTRTQRRVYTQEPSKRRVYTQEPTKREVHTEEPGKTGGGV